MTTLQIPPEARKIVGQRDNWRCGRCGVKASDWHHRRSRRVRDVHQHCACNGIMLCRTCHGWAHDNPEIAQMVGMIVRQFQPRPWRIPVRRLDGWWLQRCVGIGVPIEDICVSLVDNVPFLHDQEWERLRILDIDIEIW
jgi:hypothetical protein